MCVRVVFWLGTLAALAASSHGYVFSERDLLEDHHQGRYAARVKRQNNWDSSEEDGNSAPQQTTSLQSLLDRIRRRQEAAQQQADYDEQNFNQRGSSRTGTNRNAAAGRTRPRADGNNLPGTSRQSDQGFRRDYTTTARPIYQQEDDDVLGSRTWGSSSGSNGGGGLFGGGGDLFGGNQNRPSLIGTLISSLGQGLSRTVQGVSTALANKWNTKVAAARGVASSLINTGRTAVGAGFRAGMAHPRFAVEAVENIFQ